MASPPAGGGLDAARPWGRSEAASWLAPGFWGLGDAELLARLRRVPRPAIPLLVDDDWRDPGRIEALMNDGFELGGETHRLPLPIAWRRNPSPDHRWHARLHGAAYLPGLVAAWQATGHERLVRRWADLVGDWLDAELPPDFSSSTVTGHRVQHWVGSLHALLADPVLRAPLEPRLVRRMLASLSAQVEHLCTHGSPGSGGRTVELLAIYLAGAAFPELAMAGCWRAFALREMAANISADLRPDGLHTAQTTDRHHLALGEWMVFRQLAASRGEHLPPALDQGLRRALEVASQLQQPDGQAPAGPAHRVPGFRPLLAQGARWFDRPDWAWIASRGAVGRPPKETLAVFADSGLAVWRSGWGTGPQDFDQPHQLIFRGGPPGVPVPAQRASPGIALAAHGRPLVVEPGGDLDPEAPDRPVGHGGVPRRATAAPAAGLIGAWQAEGFALLHGRAVTADGALAQERLVACLGRDGWLVSDRREAHPAADPSPDPATRFQLHPDALGACRLRPPEGEGGCWRLDSPGLTVLQPHRPGLEVVLETAQVCGRHGQPVPAPRLSSQWRAARGRLHTLLLPWAGPVAPEVQVSPLVVAGPPGGEAWRIRIGHGAGGRVHTWLMAPGGPAGAGSASTWRWTTWAAAAAGAPAQSWQFTGTWLYLCETTEGRLLSACAPEGALLQQDWRSLPCRVPRALTPVRPGAADRG